jgi:hypothetical protein
LTERAPLHRHHSSRTDNTRTAMKEMIPMNTRPLAFFSRAGLEQAFAGLLFSATVALVASGVVAMALRAVFTA